MTNPNTKLRQLLVKSLVVGLIAYWALLFIGTHVPLPAIKSLGQSDKLVHGFSYAGLAFLLGLVVGLHRPLTWRLGILLLAGLALYAACDELLQVPIPGRHGDLWDWVADLSGIVPGLTAAVLARPLLPAIPTKNRGSVGQRGVGQPCLGEEPSS